MANDHPTASRATTTTNTDFARSVDRAILREVGDINRRGVRALCVIAAEAPADSLPPAIESWRDRWRSLGDEAQAAVADAPYLLFEWRLGTEPLAGATSTWTAHPEIRRFARILCHFAWHTSRVRPMAAPLLLGSAATECAALAALDPGALDALAESGGQRVALRWAHDERHWGKRLAAAQEADRSALWENTLAGVQRLAATARRPGGG